MACFSIGRIAVCTSPREWDRYLLPLKMPRYRLNPALLTETIEPPVALARAWATSFPLPASPCPTLPLLNLAQGVPGELPPAELQEKLRSSPTYGYGDVFGSASLRNAVAEDLSRVYHGSVTQEDVCITAGANLAFAVVAQSLAGKGDAIVLPTPWYFNHYMTLTSLGVEAIPLPTHAPDFSISEEALAELLSTRKNIKAVVCVTPNNPTGAIYSPSKLARIARLVDRHSVALVLDETYRDFLLDGSQRAKPHSLFESSLGGESWSWRDSESSSLHPTDIRLHLVPAAMIHISSFSKSYAIPGHRLGSIACDPSLLSSSGVLGPLAKALDNLQICPPVTSTQEAVAWAMRDPAQQEHRLATAVELRERRELFTRLLEGTGYTVESCGAYYAFVRHPFTEELDSESVAKAMAGLVGVVVLPGAFFMPPRSTDESGKRLRFSIANVSKERLQELPQRLHELSRLWKENGVGYGM